MKPSFYTVSVRNNSFGTIVCLAFLSVQLLEAFQSGPIGLNVAPHVVEELSCVIDHAPIHDQETMEQNVWDLLMKHEHVPLKYAQHQVTVFKFLTKLY